MPDIDFLEKKLSSDDPEERRDAVADLARSGRTGAPLLFRALRDADWRVRKTAVEALVSLADEGVIAGLTQTLSSHDNAGARNSAIEALVHIGAAALDNLLRSIAAPDADVRKFIVDILGEIREVRSVPALIEALRDSDDNIRVAAAEALGKIKDARAVEPLLDCLARRGQSWLGYAAAEALGEIGDERALEPLIGALGRNTLREPILEAIGKIGNVGTLDPLIAGLGDALRIVREVSITALLSIYRKSAASDREKIVQRVRTSAGPRAMDLLEETAGTSSGELQKAAVEVLGWGSRESSIRKLLSLLREEEMEEPMVRTLRTLDRSAFGLLLEYLNHQNALVRRVVARVLGETGRSETEGELIRLLRDENGHVRSAAAAALGRFRSRKAVPGLLQLLSDEYQNVQESAIDAIAAIGDEEALDSLIRDFTSRPAYMRKNIVILIGKSSTEKAGDALAFALKDAEADVRKAVVHGLGKLPGERSHRSLVLAAADDDPEVRMLAAEALGRAGTAKAAETLISLLQDPDVWVRAAAVRSLGRIGDERICAVLVTHLQTATDIFLLALVDVLGRLKTEQAFGPLLNLSDHPDPEVRKAVLSALSGYSWEGVRTAVVARLSDQHWSVRKTAVEILKQKGDAAVGPLLVRVADTDADLAVRQAAKEALGK